MQALTYQVRQAHQGVQVARAVELQAFLEAEALARLDLLGDGEEVRVANPLHVFSLAPGGGDKRNT